MVRSVALAAVVLGVLVQVPLLVAQTGKGSQPLVPVADLAPQDGAVSAPAPAPAPPAPAPSEPAAPEPPPLVPGDQVAAGTAPALEPTEDLEPRSDAEPPGGPLGELAQAVPEEPAPEEPEDDEPAPEEDETDPEVFEREFEDVPEEEMPPLTRGPLVPTATATPAGGLPQTGSDIVVLELMGGLLMGMGLALRLALSLD